MELFNIYEEHRATPLITAHAGCQGTEPNSRESIVAAFNSPADIVEVDIRASADGVVFLMHDNVLALDDGENVPLGNLSWNEIVHTLDSRQQREILRFEAFCDFVEEVERGVPRITAPKRPFFNLDIKDPAALPATAAIARSREIMPRVIFSGLDEEGVALAFRRIPDLSYLFNADGMLPGREAAGTEEVGIEEACSLALRCGCKGINLEWTLASAALVHHIHERGLFVMLWTVDDMPAMQRVLKYGPDSITTHYPDRLALLLEDRRKNRPGTR